MAVRCLLAYYRRRRKAGLGSPPGAVSASEELPYQQLTAFRLFLPRKGGCVKRVSDVLASLSGDDSEPLSDDARAAIREGLSVADLYVEAAADDEPGLPLGWTMDGVVEP